MPAPAKAATKTTILEEVFPLLRPLMCVQESCLRNSQAKKVKKTNKILRKLLAGITKSLTQLEA